MILFFKKQLYTSYNYIMDKIISNKIEGLEKNSDDL